MLLPPSRMRADTVPVLLGAILLISGAGCVRSVAGAGRRPVGQKATVVVMRRQVLNAAESGEGDPEASRLRARIRAAPADVEPRLQLAAHYGKIGLGELDLEHLRLAVERFPNSREARWRLAQALRAAGLPEEASGALAAFVGGPPEAGTDPELLNLLGVCYDEAGDWKSGEEAFRRALIAAPELDFLHNNLGFNLLEQGRAGEAIDAFEQALKRNPGSVVARNNLGVALARSSALSEAVRHFENVVDAASAYNNAAAALMEQSRYEESRRLLEAALDYNPKNPAALANLRLVSERDGRPVEVRLRAETSRWRRSVAWLRRTFAVEQKSSDVGN